MAPRLSARASRARRVSYRETSFQSDDARDASYASDAAADASDAANAAPDPPAQRTMRHSTRRAPQLRASLREPSSDDNEDFIDDDDDVDDDDDDDDDDEEDSDDDSLRDEADAAVDTIFDAADRAAGGARGSSPPPPKRRRTARAQRGHGAMGAGRMPARSARAARPPIAASPARRAVRPRTRKAAVAKSKKPAGSEMRTRSAMETDGFCPPWASLPPEIVMAIFDFAYWGIEDDGKAASWLVQAARTCRAFAQPALEALYRTPRFLSSRQIMLFNNTIHHLFHDRPESPYIDYLSKVKYLAFDERMLSRSFDIIALINMLPSLVDIDIWSSKDYKLRGFFQLESESFMQYKYLRWEKVDLSHRPLRSWHWNMKMGPLYEICYLHHVYPIFSKLRKLTVTNFQAHSKGIIPSYLGSVLSPGRRLQDEELRDAMERHAKNPIAEPPPNDLDRSQLSLALAGPTLETLRFEFCHALCGDFFVPRENLRTLEIHCCDQVNSAGLAACLAVSGAQLRTLVLDHNRALNLEFLQTLGAHCPRLTTLAVNLLYFSRPYEAPPEPKYKALLEPEHVPHWPAGLEALTLQYLRRWSLEGAVALLESIEREPFPRLRSLVLSASVDMPWQTRASFRDEWLARFDRAFLRPWPGPPSRHLQSVKEFRLWKAARERGERASAERRDGASTSNGQGAVDAGGGKLRLRRRTAAYNPGALADDSDDDDDDDYDDDDAVDDKGKPQGRSLGSLVKSVLGPAPNPPATTDEGRGIEKRPAQLATGRKVPQALCDVVDVRIDNARPRDRAYRESDMLDSEESGDEDYPGARAAPCE
jgi:hypothetical protein